MCINKTCEIFNEITRILAGDQRLIQEMGLGLNKAFMEIDIEVKRSLILTRRVKISRNYQKYLKVYQLSKQHVINISHKSWSWFK